MKIHILTTMRDAVTGKDLLLGDVVEMSDEQAEAIIARGWAEKVAPQKKKAAKAE